MHLEVGPARFRYFGHLMVANWSGVRSFTVVAYMKYVIKFLMRLCIFHLFGESWNVKNISHVYVFRPDGIKMR